MKYHTDVTNRKLSVWREFRKNVLLEQCTLTALEGVNVVLPHFPYLLTELDDILYGISPRNAI